MNPKHHQQIQETRDKARALLDSVDESSFRSQLTKLEKKSLAPNFWQEADSQTIVQEIADLNHRLTEIKNLKESIANLDALAELGQESDQEETLSQELEETLKKTTHQIKQLELVQFLSGKYDRYSAILSIHSGQGGTEAMDWAEMLSRMYLRFFEKKDWSYTLVSESRGEEAGIKQVTYEVKARFAYGYLKGERGTHRLVRLSPFNADSLRQTSFALVEVMPLIEENDTQLKLKTEDLDWHFTKSGGAGGQNVNKVNTAVELTHKPTGITVRCREERSQFQNKERALKTLKAKLALLEEEKLNQEMRSVKGEHHHASWGNQIRNYVLHPYKLVKDTRTQVESNQPEAVLDGDLEEFINAEIKLSRK